MSTEMSPTLQALIAANAAVDAAERRHWDAEHSGATRSELAEMAREADALQEVAYVAARAHRAARDAWSARVAEAEKRADDAYAAAELANGSGQAEADYQAALANLRAVRAL